MPNSATPAHTGHRKRLKQRLSNVGVDSFLDHEFLELLLTYSIARKDTKPLAWALLKRFGSIAEVLDADENALMEVKGIGPATARLIMLVRNAFKRYTLAKMHKRIKIETLHDVLEYCRASLAGKHEEFVEVIFLSTRFTVISTRVVAKGSISHASVEPRQIVEYALREKASALIIVHNHPSGDPSPSPQDIEWTLKTQQAANLLNITLFDHLIIAKNGYYSFNGAGYLNIPNAGH